jgi:hypothetical protein
MNDDFYSFWYGPEQETGDWLIGYAGIIVARIPKSVEKKWPGITLALAKGAVYEPDEGIIKTSKAAWAAAGFGPGGRTAGSGFDVEATGADDGDEKMESYDQKCFDLAAHFIPQTKKAISEALRRRLAQHIQNEVENWLEYYTDGEGGEKKE